MPSRFSPGVPIYQPGAAEVVTALGAALGAIERKEDRETRRRLIDAAERRAQAEEERAKEAAERARQLQEIQLYLQGYRPTAPTRPAPDVPVQGDAEGVPLAAALGEVVRPDPDEGPRLRALPGAFVPELGGFTNRPLFEQPLMLGSQLRGGGVPENYVPLPGGGYIDLSATPEARARALAKQQRQEELERQRAAATTLARLLGLSDEEIEAAANLTPEQILGVVEMRRAAEERAERDPLARERFLAGEERRRNQALTRITNMLATGADRHQVAQAMATDPDLAGYWNYDDIIAIERRIQQEMGDQEDPAFIERRRALSQLLGAPTTELQQQILDALAAGATKDQILSDMRAQGVPDTVLDQARRYMLPIR